MAAKCFFGISHSEVFLKLENAEMSHFPFKYKNIDFMLIYWMNSKKKCLIWESVIFISWHNPISVFLSI